MQCDGDLMNIRSNRQACTEGICDINIQVNNFIRSAADIRIMLTVLLTSLSCCHCFKKTKLIAAITKCPAGICCTVIVTCQGSNQGGYEVLAWNNLIIISLK